MKTFAQQIASQLGFTRIGPLVQLPIALTAATGNTTLVAIAAGERFVIEAIELVPGGAGGFTLRSGATGVTGAIAGAAGSQYVFCEKFGQADGDDIVINRTDSIALAGSITYRVLSNPA